jgi:type I restriction enzyme S subunit
LGVIFKYQQVELGKIGLIKGGKRLPNDSDLTDIKTSHPYIRARDIRNGKINFDNPKYITDEVFSKIKRYTVCKGDVVITIVGANIGDVAYIDDEFDGSNLTENAVKIIPKDQIVDPIFLKYALVPSYMKEYFQIVSSGAAQGKLGLYKIKIAKIPLPTFLQQQKIAAILSAYDDLIENNLERIKLLEEMAQITYEEWFVRLKFPGHETTQMDSETGLPVGWEKTTLRNCCVLIMGQSPKSEFYNYEKGGLPFHQGVKDHGFRFPENTCWSTDGARIAKAKDILFSVRAPVGRLNIAIEDIILGRGLSAIRHKNGLQSFLFYQLKQIFFQEDMLGGGAIFASVTKEDMLRIELIKPDKRTELEFNQFAAAIDQNIENLHRQNQLLKEARDILLPRLMTGMIDVEQLNHFVGADLSAHVNSIERCG